MFLSNIAYPLLCLTFLVTPLFLSQAILGAGHYVYADQPEEFNQKVKEICHLVDWAHGAVGVPATDAPLEQYPTPTKEQKYNSRTRPPLGWTLHCCLMKSLPRLSQLVPSRRTAFLSPTQNGSTQKSSTLIVALNKGYLSFWCTEKLCFFSWDFSHFYLTLLIRCLSFCSLYANLGHFCICSLNTVTCTLFHLHVFTVSKN